MTTVEQSTMYLTEALLVAGTGGTVSREGLSYTVGTDDEGEWTLTGDQFTGEPYGSFLTTGWTVGEDQCPDCTEPTAMLTFTQFFDALSVFTFVRAPYSEYIFKGWETDTNGNRFVRLIHSRYMEYLDVTASDLDHECTWEVVQNENGNKTADQPLRMALRHMASERTAAQCLRTQVESLTDTNRDIVADFRQLNDHMNQYATDADMCSDYERRIFGWNDTFSVLKLAGRRKSYYVPVRVPAIYDGHMYVNGVSARSPEEALEMAKAMSASDILKNVMEQGYSTNAVRVEFDGMDAPHA